MALHNIGQALRALDAGATPFVGLPSTLPNDQDIPIWRGILIRRESSTGIPAWAMTLHTATQSFYSLDMMESALCSYVETAVRLWRRTFGCLIPKLRD